LSLASCGNEALAWRNIFTEARRIAANIAKLPENACHFSILIVRVVVAPQFLQV
jgi:ABC-type uncharacterized transport system permease subunit